MTERSTLTRALPMLEFAPAPGRGPAPAGRAGRRSPGRVPPGDPDAAPVPPVDPRLPDEPERLRGDGRPPAGRGLRGGPSLEAADLVVINTCAIREGAEQKVIGRQGQLARLKAANPGLRVVLTGCSVREPDRAGLRRRYPAVDLFLRPDEEPELVDRLGLASAQAPIGAIGATTTVGRTVVGVADHLAGTGAGGRRGNGRPLVRDLRLAADHLRLRQDLHLLHRAVQPRAGTQPAVRRHRRRGAGARRAGYREVTLLGQNVNSYGHDLAPDPRFGHVEEARWAGRQLDLAGRPDLAELIRAIDGLRTADGRPAIGRLRFVTSHPWDLSDRLIAALADCPSVCEHLHLPVQSGSDAVLRRMGRQYTIEHYLERLARIREAVPGIAISTDIIVGFCGETEAQFEETLRLLETVRYDQVFAAAYSPRPGTPATRLADDVPAADKRRRLNTLLALQEGIGLERNRAWLGREVEVLVDALTAPRPHAHDDDQAEPARDGGAGRRLSGRTRTNKLVHLSGDPALIGQTVTVRIEHAGPYALRGALVGA